MKAFNFVCVFIVVSFLAAAALGCSPRINVFPDYTDSLKEVTLSGKGGEKILILPVSGVIDIRPREGLIFTRPSMVEEVIAQLELAREDKNVKAVILRIDSPGGSATASDILYEEIKAFKKETGKTVLALMMDLSASGGYYTAVSADRIIAHPTTVTGSIGVIFFTANIEGLFDKIGVEVEPIKSGKYKDMGSPFRGMNDEERKLFQAMIDEMYNRFVDAVDKGRPDLSREQVLKLADGRIYTARQALGAGLIDEIGYTENAVESAKRLAKLSENAKVIVYRRNPKENENIYSSQAAAGTGRLSLVDLGLDRYTFVPRTGFYYLWEPGLVKP